MKATEAAELVNAARDFAFALVKYGSVPLVLYLGYKDASVHDALPSIRSVFRLM
jgi:hypothetical protein